MSERARKYFNTFPNPREPKYLSIGAWLFSFNWAVDCWTTITDREKEETHWLFIGKVRNMKGQTLYKICIGKLLIVFGK